MGIFLSLIELAERSCAESQKLMFGLKLRRRPRDSCVGSGSRQEDQSAVTEDVSGGGFVRTDAPFRVGQVMDVDVVHPQTFPISAAACGEWAQARKERDQVGAYCDDIEEARLKAFYPPVVPAYHLRSSLDAMTVCFRAISRQF